MKRLAWSLVLLVALLPIVAAADIRITNDTADSTEPAVAIGQDQLARVVWAAQVGGVYQIHWACVDLNGSIVEGPVQLTTGTLNCRLPQVSIDSVNLSYVVWVQGSGSGARVYWARIGLTGLVEAGPVMMNTGNGEYRRPDIATAADGTSHIVFEWASVLFQVKYIVLNSSGQVVRSLIAGDYDLLNTNKYPSVTLEPSGYIYIVWNDYSAYSYGLYLAKYAPDGTLIGRARIKNGNSISWPSITAPRNGWLWILYQQPSSGIDRIWTWLGSDVAQIASPAPGPSRRPRVVGADNQPVYGVWEDWSTGTSRIMAGKWNIDGTYVDNDIVLTGGTSGATLPDIGTDRNGFYAVVWRDTRDGNGEIYLHWIPSNGVAVTVRSRGFGVPVPNARVVLYQGSTPVAQRQTGPEGTCLFGDQPVGEYWLNCYYQQFDVDEPPVVQVPAEGFAPIDLVVSTEFEIRGRVADGFNDGGIRNAVVKLFRAGYGAVDSTLTGPDGSVRFSTADTGQYYLWATKTRLPGAANDTLYAPRRSATFPISALQIGTPIQAPLLALSTNVVVLVHGWTGSHLIWSGLADTLSSRKWNVSHDIDLPGGIGEWHGMAALGEQADSLRAWTDTLGVRSFHVVAHSMGGLVTRYMTEKLQAGELPRVVNLITLATPHHGTPLVNVVEAIVKWLGSELGGSVGGAVVSDLVAGAEVAFPSIVDLKPNSASIKGLNQGAWWRNDWTGMCMLDNPNPERNLAPLTRYLTVTGDDHSTGEFAVFGGLLAGATCAGNDGIVPTESARMWCDDPRVHNYEARLIAEPVHHKSDELPAPGICASTLLQQWVCDRLQDPPGFSPTEALIQPARVAAVTGAISALGSLQIPALPGQARRDSFPVDSCDTLRVNWTWFDGSVGLSLVDPDGAVIDSAAAATDPLVERMFDPLGRWGCYVIAEPRTGIWKMVTGNVSSELAEQQTYVWLQGGSTANLSLSIVPDGDQPYAKRFIRADFKAADGSPLLNATVEAHAVHPSGGETVLLMADDGVAPDETAADGVYGGLLAPEERTGTTVVNVVARSSAPALVTRTVMRSFSITKGANIQIMAPGLLSNSETNRMGTPVHLAAGVQNAGPDSARVEIVFWLDEPLTTLSTSTLQIAPGAQSFATASHLPLKAGNFSYHVRARPLDGTEEGDWEDNVGAATLEIGQIATGVESGSSGEPAPQEIERELNGRIVAIVSAYPNPFNPIVRVRYAVAADGSIRLSVYDLRGRLVKRLVSEVRPRGVFEVIWDGTHEDGSTASSGIYLLRLDGAGAVAHRKVTLVR
ncbi:MAG: alpha/beta fold hydrolase [Candidatus Krumholzibacteriia bacterium]